MEEEGCLCCHIKIIPEELNIQLKCRSPGPDTIKAIFIFDNLNYMMDLRKDKQYNKVILEFIMDKMRSLKCFGPQNIYAKKISETFTKNYYKALWTKTNYGIIIGICTFYLRVFDDNNKFYDLKNLKDVYSIELFQKWANNSNVCLDDKGVQIWNKYTDNELIQNLFDGFMMAFEYHYIKNCFLRSIVM